MTEMMAKARKVLAHVKKNESGQAAFIAVLLLLALGALLIPPLLSLMDTGLKASQIHEEIAQRYYAADAGIEDALLQVKNGKLPSSYDYNYREPYSYLLHDSTVNDKDNVQDVDIAIQNAWIPKDLTAPDATTAEQIIEQGKLLILGNSIPPTTYQIKTIYYYGGSDSIGQNLGVQKIGIWLPPGFHYVSGSSSLETGGSSKPYYPSSVEITPYKSGEAVVWTFSSSPKFKGFPSIGGTFTLPDTNDAFTITGGAVADSGTITKTSSSGSISVTPAGGATYVSSTGAWTTPASGGTIVVKSTSAVGTTVSCSWSSTKASATAAITTDADGDVTTGYPMVRSFTFQFTPVGQTPGAALSWINTSGVTDLVPGYSGISYTWDADKEVYNITSTATDAADVTKQTAVEAYATKIEMRQLGSAISGDYVAIGGTLMTPNPNDSSNDQKLYRGRLLMGSSATVASGTGVGQIPASATVQAAYLYWSGWIDYHYWYKSGSYWYWSSTGITGLKYNASSLTTLVETNAKVNTVKFGAGGVMQTITTHQWQVMPNTDVPGTWSYSCFYDATDQVKQLINNGKLGSNGAGTYTLQHADAVVNVLRSGYPGVPGGTTAGNYYSFTLYNTGSYTGYPLGTPATKLPGSSSYPVCSSTTPCYEWAYAGWSLIIIYSSPDTTGHQLYLYDDFVYSGMDQDAPLPNGNTISGFLAPPDIASGGQYAAHMTCFVGEGDEYWDGDFLAFNAPLQYWSNPGTIPNTYKLWDGITLPSSEHNSASDPNNVWNSNLAATTSGIDIDTFTISYPTIQPGDTSARVDLYTGTDSWNLIYMILSFRSTVTTGGTIGYLIKSGGG